MELFDALCIDSGIEAFASVAKTFRDRRIEIVDYAASDGAGFVPQVLFTAAG